MSDKLPAIKPQRLIRVLEAKGWEHRRTRGSHHYLVHPERRDAIAVPVHNRDVMPGSSSASSRPPAGCASCCRSRRAYDGVHQ